MDAPDSLSPRGLDAEAVARARRLHGRNEMASPRRHGPLATLRDVLSEPMFVLLLVAAALYLAIGERAEGLLLAFFALLSLGLVVAQQERSQRALDALRALAAPRARVWREGRLQRLAAEELVPGDLVQLDEGERVAADARVLEAEALTLDESLLSGESQPVARQAADTVHAGTLVVGGHARVRVSATGAATQIGRIGASLGSIEAAPTPLTLQLRRTVRLFATLGLLASLALVAWHGLLRGDWLQGLLAGIALAMAMLPEEFPMAMSIFLALGAWRLAQVQVLVRRPAAIDSLGACTMLCLDKTGTLTRNELRVLRAEMPGGATIDALAAAARLASRPDGSDPLDRAVLAFAPAPLPPPAERLRDYPLRAGRPLMGRAWQEETEVRIAVKGAPEAVLALCGMEHAAARAWLDAAAAMAAAGLRVIAVAEARAGTAPADLAHLAGASPQPLGLLGLADPLRDDAAAAVAAARRAGIEVAMITGDHADTALAIARQAGLDTSAGVLGGEALRALDAAGLAEALRRIRVFARVDPAQKLRLVEAFAAAGHVVAMTGDGVNDAPALKAAHVGIAMGARGSDVAREAAQVVLLDDGVGRIVDGIAVGRRIFDNLRRVMLYIVAIHVPIAAAALLPVLAGWPPLLLPVHVALTEMVIDPMCSLAFENAPPRPGLMTGRPREAGTALLDRPLLLGGLLQGAALATVVIGVFGLALRVGLDASQARALALVALTAGSVALVAVDASAALGRGALLRREFLSFWIVAALTTLWLAAGLALAPLRALLQFGTPPAAALALVLGTVFAMAPLLVRGRRLTQRKARATGAA